MQDYFATLIPIIFLTFPQFSLGFSGRLEPGSQGSTSQEVAAPGTPPSQTPDGGGLEQRAQADPQGRRDLRAVGNRDFYGPLSFLASCGCDIHDMYLHRC